MQKQILKEKMLCISCKEELNNQGVIFNCPNCGNEKIARCIKCKKISASYSCSKCGFVGP